ncbi:hypothetical protein VTL71DRAFT_2987 [Oculimacula yallundae]|uniref:holo-[acyl-carrier-protein] synthase n=1 Tax=Oculimacula yallundae TaxID=86028 RepID=A0ABR4C847_9HELO
MEFKETTAEPQVVQWFVDTRPLWPVKTGKARDEVQQLKTVASKALSLLTEAEQTSVLKYYHLKDAKMSLVSHLLKHLIISKCGIPWSKTIISRNDKKKPIFKPETTDGDDHVLLDFNVSHQAGLVCLIAAIGSKDVSVGADIVCVNERLQQDYAHISKHGFDDWVDVHADVLADSEVAFLKGAPGGDLSRGAETVVEKQLRRFYALWCLREAYVKMTGDALLAPWLKDLEILDVQPPLAKEDAGVMSLEDGENVRQFANYFQGKAVTDVKTEITALGKHYMIAGTIRVPKELKDSAVKLGKWKQLDFEKDVMEAAEASL